MTSGIVSPIGVSTVALIVVLAAQLCAIGQATQINVCDRVQPIGKVTSLDVSGCQIGSRRTPCKLVRNTKVEMHLKFTLPKKLCNAKVNVKGHLGFDLPFQNGPATEFGLKDNCLEAETEHTMVYSINIIPMYPPVEVGVKIEMTGTLDDGSTKTAFCVLIPSAIRLH